MNALEKMIEGKDAAHGHHDLAVQNELLLLERTDGLHDLRKVARQRLAGLRLNRNIVAVAKDDGSEAVPLRLEQPFVARRDLVDPFRFHRWIGRCERESHFLKILYRFTRFVFASTGFQRSPTSSSRRTALSMRKSSIFTPPSSSSHVTGIETPANGVGRTE